MNRLKFLFLLLAAVPAFALETIRFDYGSCGAIPDDGQDDAVALQKALDSLVAQGGGTLEVPSGVYEMHARIEVDGRFDFLRIEGAGQGLSRFVCINDEGILKINARSVDSVVEIVDLDLPPGKPNCGTCLELIKPFNEPQDREYNLLLSNLELKPVDLNTCHYARVFVAEGWMPLIDNINSSGFYGPNFNTFEGKRRKYEAESIVVLKKAYKPRIQYSNFWAAKYGIVIELTDAHEKPTIAATVSVENANGIQITKQGARPLSNPVWIDGCHWNNAFSGLVMKNIDSFRLVQNCLYGAWDIEDGYHDMHLINCSGGELVDNSFWFGVKSRSNIYIEKNCHDISIRNTHFGRGISREPVIIEDGARNIRVADNLYGTVFAMDEGDTFGLWEFEETQAGKALDKDRLHPGRDNDLLLNGAEIVGGSESMKLGKALSFRDLSAEACPAKEWSGAAGVRIHTCLKIPEGFGRGESTILEVTNIYRLYLDEGTLCFAFQDSRGRKTVLRVGNVTTRRNWLPVLVDIDPSLDRTVLEVSGFGGDRRFIENLELNRKERPLRLAPEQKTRKKFTGAIDQLWIQNL